VGCPRRVLDPERLGINRDPRIFPFADVTLEKQSKRKDLSMKDGLHRS
jgi:hypothetical protein